MRAVTVSRFGQSPTVGGDLDAGGASRTSPHQAGGGLDQSHGRQARIGRVAAGPDRLSEVLGLDGAGVVEAVGDGTTRFPRVRGYLASSSSHPSVRRGLPQRRADRVHGD